MDVKFNVKYKFKVNGKEYGSLEEMPADIRETYEKAVSKAGGINFEKISSNKIVFNGQEYGSIESMPADVRQMYETIMNKVKSGEGTTIEKSGFQIGVNTTGLKDKGIVTGDISQPIAPKSLFSPLTLLIAGAIIVLLAALYIMFGVGSH